MTAKVSVTGIGAAIGGICWLVAYILILRRAWLDRTPGIPFVALCANFSWELTFAFVLPDPWPPQRLLNILWFSLDVVLLAQFIALGRNDVPTAFAGKLFL